MSDQEAASSLLISLHAHTYLPAYSSPNLPIHPLLSNSIQKHSCNHLGFFKKNKNKNIPAPKAFCYLPHQVFSDQNSTQSIAIIYSDTKHLQCQQLETMKNHPYNLGPHRLKGLILSFLLSLFPYLYLRSGHQLLPAP